MIMTTIVTANPLLLSQVTIEDSGKCDSKIVVLITASVEMVTKQFERRRTTTQVIIQVVFLIVDSIPQIYVEAIVIYSIFNTIRNQLC